ncbi:uncharacterized protein LOC129577307 isoform X2 [Sitodiplosis mosellana]|nr:uncharacterized protein LOC129577307 isoform X2 [Sitodiplosis mosellana]
MAPSTGKSPMGTQTSSGSQKISTEILVGWPTNAPPKENQRPPVYNAEDYIVSLKKFGRRTSGTTNGEPKSIYDTSEEKPNSRAATLPAKHSAFKNPIQPLPDEECEMSLKQFGSITDLLTKLRADLRASFPSFVQEFVAAPLDGVSLLLEVLRSIQLSQQNGIGQTNTTGKMNAQTYQRRALLDELACLQCLNLCCLRSPEARIRIGTSPIGLMPLAASATGQGIRSRILALQLLTTACDKHAAGVHSSQKGVYNGHTSVSEALSTLRLRCGEPVRFRLLAGMLNSGGGTGELQYYGLKFINTFLESADSVQSRLYLQAELQQAGFDPLNMSKLISTSSPWYDKLRAEIKYFEDINIDIDKLMVQNREGDKIRGQMAVLERRVQILQEEKTVLTTMERRLQERCAELQREVFRLQGAQHNDGYKSLEKHPVALPRQVLPHINKNGSSEHEDEGISSSETGQSLSPEPILILPQNTSKKYTMNEYTNNNGNSGAKDDDVNATIEEVIEELENIVHDAEKEIEDLKSERSKSSETLPPYHPKSHFHSIDYKEKEIVPVNLLPQPPKKSRSLSHLLSGGSEYEDSDYGVMMANNETRISYYDDIDMEIENSRQHGGGYRTDVIADGEQNPDLINQTSTNRELLNVIMDAREKDNIFMTTPGHYTKMKSSEQSLIPKSAQTPQKFNGVFFMTEMSTPAKYPKPDITAALEARRVSKSIERLESYGSSGLDSMIDIIMTTSERKQEMKNAIAKAPNNFAALRDMALHTTFSMRTKSPSPVDGAIVFSGGMKTNRLAFGMSGMSGSKLSDLPSGLY